MAYNVVPTLATGDPWTAANHNTYIRDNFLAGVPALAAAKSNLFVATAANAADVLAVGSDYKNLRAASAEVLGMKWSLNAPGTQVGSNTSQSLNDNTSTVLTINTEYYDEGGYYPGSGDTITVPTGMGGIYLITVLAYFDAGASVNKLRQVGITCSTAGTFWQSNVQDNGSNAIWCNFSRIVQLLAAETVQMRGQQISGGALNIWYPLIGLVRMQ